MPVETTRAFPKFYHIDWVSGKKMAQFFKYGYYINLKRMKCGIKDLLSHMDRVSDNYDFGNAFLGGDLVYTISNSE